MKKLVFITLVLFANTFLAQQTLFEKVKEQLKKDHPDLGLSNRLIMVNVWSVNDAESRKANVELNKTATTYEYAKLKGGSKGIIGVIINVDADKSLSTITLGKDKVTKAYAVIVEPSDVTGITNMVFDATGNQVYKEIAPSDIFESIHKLITR